MRSESHLQTRRLHIPNALVKRRQTPLMLQPNTTRPLLPYFPSSPVPFHPSHLLRFDETSPRRHRIVRELLANTTHDRCAAMRLAAETPLTNTQVVHLDWEEFG